MVALDDGVVDTSYQVETGCVLQMMYVVENERPQLARWWLRSIDITKTLDDSSNYSGKP